MMLYVSCTYVVYNEHDSTSGMLIKLSSKWIAKSVGTAISKFSNFGTVVFVTTWLSINAVKAFLLYNSLAETYQIMIYQIMPYILSNYAISNYFVKYIVSCSKAIN